VSHNKTETRERGRGKRKEEKNVERQPVNERNWREREYNKEKQSFLL
jgi:hypothetical protein